MPSGSANVLIQASPDSPIVYGSRITMAPAAWNRAKSAATFVLSMFQMIRPGLGLAPFTSSCGPTVTNPSPICQPV